MKYSVYIFLIFSLLYPGLSAARQLSVPDTVYAGKLKRQGHEVISTDINKYGVQFATGAVDGKIVIWDAEDGSFINVLKGHKGAVFSLKFSPDGGRLASGGKDKNIRIWDVLSAQTEFELEGHDGPIASVNFSPDGYKLLSCSGDKTLKIWDLSTKTCEVTVGGFNREITDAAFSPDGSLIAAVSADRSLRIFGAASGEKKVHIKKAHGKYSRCVAFSPNGKTIVTAGDDGFVRLWDVKSLTEDENTEPKKEIRAHGRQWIQSLAYSSDGRYLATGGHDGRVKVLDLQSDEPEIDSYELPKENRRQIIYDLAFAYDGTKLLTAEYKNFSDLWDMSFLDIRPVGIASARSRGGGGGDTDDESEEDNFDDDLDDFDTSPEAGRDFSLVIGADDYTHWNKLSNAVKDARDVKGVLQNKYGFKKEHTIEIYNKAITKRRLFNVFDSLVKTLNGQDNLIIYYSGHGEYNARFKQGFWVPSDAGLKDRSAYFSNTELLDFLGEMHAKHVFLIADACFSGALFSGRYSPSRNTEMMDHSRWGLTSGNKEEVSDGLPNQNSPFAKILLEKLRKNSGELPVSELILHIISSVKKDKRINQKPMGEPIRLVGHESGEFIFKSK